MQKEFSWQPPGFILAKIVREMKGVNMRWRRYGPGLLVLFWLGGCAGGGGLGPGDTLSPGQREADLVARKGQPQEVQTAPGGGKIYIYTTANLDQVAAMGGGAWVKPDQVHYRLNDRGIITEVLRYPYGKRNFIFPTRERRTETAQAPALPAGESGTLPTRAAAAPREAARTPGVWSPSPVKSPGDAASRLELNMTREEVRRVLGPPERTEGFRAGSRPVIVWYYLWESQPGRLVATPLVFEEGRLSGWGDTYYRRRLREISNPRP